MNSSWKAFRALSAASWMGMSLWRMYSAREQDQPPSVLLVGTFYKQQETDQAVTGAPAEEGGSAPARHTRVLPGACALLPGEAQLPATPRAAPLRLESWEPTRLDRHTLSPPTPSTPARPQERGSPTRFNGAVSPR